MKDEEIVNLDEELVNDDEETVNEDREIVVSMSIDEEMEVCSGATEVNTEMGDEDIIDGMIIEELMVHYSRKKKLFNSIIYS